MAAAGVLLLAALCTVAPASASTGLSGHSTAAFDAKVSAYTREHPNDYTGLAKLVKSMGGTFTVSTSDTGPTTPEIATSVFKSYDGQRDATPGTVSPMAFPSNAFVVSIASSRAPGSTVAYVTGGWNWRDDFVGQGPPVDIAALRFSKACGSYQSYETATYRYDNVSTNLSTLRSSGVGGNGPIWNVADTVSGFMNYADHGYVGVHINIAGCGAMQSAFDYEGNKGGSVVSASVGWGGLSVGYSNPGSILQLSTVAVTI